MLECRQPAGMPGERKANRMVQGSKTSRGGAEIRLLLGLTALLICLPFTGCRREEGPPTLDSQQTQRTTLPALATVQTTDLISTATKSAAPNTTPVSPASVQAPSQPLSPSPAPSLTPEQEAARTSEASAATPAPPPSRSPARTLTVPAATESASPVPAQTQTAEIAEILTSLPTIDPAQNEATKTVDEEPLPEVVGLLRISTILVSQDQLVVGGQSSLPEGTCILTKLSAGGDDVTWWPDGTCANLTGNEWQLEITLGTGEIPGRLDDSLNYQLEAWADIEPVIEAAPFTFDVSGPPGL